MGSFLESIFGSKPDVPALEKLDINKEQQKAVAGNLAVLPQAQELTSKANLFSQQQIDAMLERAGGGSLFQDSAAAIDKMVKGELPMSDVAQSVNDSVARSFNLGTGGGGTGMGRSMVARDLGLREVDVIGKGLSAAESWLRTAGALYEPSMLSVSSMFVSPMQQYAADNEQNIQQFQRNWMSSQIGAMPDPVLSGINAEVMTLASSFLGGMGGKMGGGGFGGGGGGGGGMAGNYTQSYGGFAPDFASNDNTPYGPN